MMKEIVIIGKNRVGLLADIAELLGNFGINIDSISAYQNNDEAVIRIITSDYNTALKHLSKINGIRIKESEVIVLDLPNKPGELGKITRKLANKQIDLETVYIAGRTNDVTHVVIKPSSELLLKTKEILGIR